MNNKKRITIISANTLIFALLLLIIPNASFAENLTIKNIGTLGITNSNQEFTSIQTVILETDFDPNSTCRYTNDAGLDWTAWETCQTLRYWQLTSDSGMKTVNVSINHTDESITNFSDTIYYNYTGAGLDTTPPTSVVITYQRFSNNNQSISFNWSASTDYESELLAIPLLYSYNLYINSTLFNSSALQSSRVVTRQINVSDASNITIDVIAYNSAGLTNTSSTNLTPTTIDLVPPSNVSITIDGFPNDSAWYKSSSIYVNWSAADNNQIGGYSYVLTTNNDVIPDETRELGINSEFNHSYKNFTNLDSGIYYFKIKARDEAGNFGSITNYTMQLDNTPPEKARIITAEQDYGSNLTFSWYKAYDLHSGVTNYTIQVWNNSGFNETMVEEENITVSESANIIRYTFIPSAFFETYHVRVKAIDNLGNVGQWSDEETAYDSTPPAITRLLPNVNPMYSEVIFKAITDEKAVCYYLNGDDQLVKFIYTNSTYHETRPRNSPVTANITCFDMSGNMRSQTFSTPTLTNSVTSISLNDETGYASQIINMTITVATTLTGVKANDLALDIDGEQLTEYSLEDNHDGTYQLYFKAPKQSGTYTLNANIADQTDDAALTINEAKLMMTFTNALTDEDDTQRISYGKINGIYVGLAGEGDADAQSDPAFISANTSTENRGYLFLAKKMESTSLKDARLKDKTFLSQKNPAFATHKKNSYVIQARLAYDYLNINSTQEISKGKHNIYIKRMPSTDKKTVYISTAPFNENNEQMIKYG